MESTVNRLSGFASKQQNKFDQLVSPEERKRTGHFGTPSAIADFMADMFSDTSKRELRILDPGAGVGTLTAAVCQKIAEQPAPRSIFCEVWENDIRLQPMLSKTLEHCRRRLIEVGHEFDFRICNDDFILSNTQKSLFDSGPRHSFDLAIMNPPYFKLRKDSPHARAMEHVVHGQPNIYALFMALACDMLMPGGEMVAITPRSYFNGPYFRRFRRWFLDRVAIRQIHVFDSRKDAFRSDSVLQESVIVRCERSGHASSVLLSSSAGSDLFESTTQSVNYEQVIDNKDGDCVVRVVTDEFEKQIIECIDRQTERLHSLGFNISTGPVVTFRSTEFLREGRARNTAPLLWMHNVRPFVTRFPTKMSKPAHIVASKESQRLLVPANTYVLLKRFTSKEECRRLVAGVFTPADSYSRWLGLENHLNYIYRFDGKLTSVEAYGLAAYFNSYVVDRYFRAISGNTQVNATELRALPMPDATSLKQIGHAASRTDLSVTANVEKIVGEALQMPCQLIEKLAEAVSE